MSAELQIANLREWIHGALSSLYQFANDPEPGINFSIAFASTDTLLDVEEALHSVRRSPWPRDAGLSYIYADGILQTLIKQQDAVEKLANLFQIGWTKKHSQKLIRVRDLRVQATGHPVRHDKPRQGSTFLARYSPGPFKISMGTYWEGGGFEATEIDLLDLIQTQERELVKAMRLIWGVILLRYPNAAHDRWRPWIANEQMSTSTMMLLVGS
jgi:hypothetical protein